MSKKDTVIKTSVGTVHFPFLLEPCKAGTAKKTLGKRVVESPIPAAYKVMFIPDSADDMNDMIDVGMTVKTVDAALKEKIPELKLGAKYINAKRSVLDRDGQPRAPLRVVDGAGNVLTGCELKNDKGQTYKIGNGSKVKISYIETSGPSSTGCFLTGVQLIKVVPYTVPTEVIEGAFVANTATLSSAAKEDVLASKVSVTPQLEDAPFDVDELDTDELSLAGE